MYLPDVNLVRVLLWGAVILILAGVVVGTLVGWLLL